MGALHPAPSLAGHPRTWVGLLKTRGEVSRAQPTDPHPYLQRHQRHRMSTVPPKTSPPGEAEGTGGSPAGTQRGPGSLVVIPGPRLLCGPSHAGGDAGAGPTGRVPRRGAATPRCRARSGGRSTRSRGRCRRWTAAPRGAASGRGPRPGTLLRQAPGRLEYHSHRHGRRTVPAGAHRRRAAKAEAGPRPLREQPDGGVHQQVRAQPLPPGATKAAQEPYAVQGRRGGLEWRADPGQGAVGLPHAVRHVLRAQRLGHRGDLCEVRVTLRGREPGPPRRVRRVDREEAAHLVGADPGEQFGVVRPVRPAVRRGPAGRGCGGRGRRHHRRLPDGGHRHTTVRHRPASVSARPRLPCGRDPASPSR